jgi:hypothetical protein
MTSFVSATLYNRNGTRNYPLSNAVNITWTDELKGEGSFTFEFVDLNAISEGDIGKLVKFSYGDRADDYVWTGVIEKIVRVQTDERIVLQVSGRGARSLLENALIYKSGAGTSRLYTDQYVGAIMEELFDEAQARGALIEMSLGFDDTTDSNSVAWGPDQEITIEERVGATLAEVASRHADAAVDVWVDADLVLQYAVERGVDTTTQTNPVVLRIAQNAVNVTREVNGPVRNVIYTEYGNGQFVETVGTTTGTYGRRETFLSLNNVDSQVTAQNITDRTMPTLETPADSMTAEVLPEGYEPYLHYNVGDYVYVTDRFGDRYTYRVRALTISVQGENIRVVPELGTVRAQLEERLRRLIQRQEAKTAGGEASSAASASDYAAVGAEEGALTYGAEVLTYDPATGEGTADAPTIDDDPISFINGTGGYLAIGDEIVLITLTDNDPATPDVYAAIGITQRAGAVTPVQQPVGSLNPAFPLNTADLPNSMNTFRETGRLSTDYNNYMGLGADLILGAGPVVVGGGSYGNEIRAYSRNTLTSSAISVPPGGANSDYFVFSDGRLLTFTSTAIYARDPGTGAWTTHDFSGAGIDKVTTDYTNGWVWIYTAGATAPAGGPFWSFTANDAAPVARGTLGTGLTVATVDTNLRMIAHAGKLVMQHNDAETTGFRFHVKNSNDTNNFDWDHITGDYIVPTPPSATDNTRGLGVPTANGFYYLTRFTTSTPDEAAINFFDYTTGVTTSYLTGVEWSSTDLVRPWGYTVTSSGIHAISCVRPISGTNRVSLATNNLVTTQYVYDYLDDSINIYDTSPGHPVEVASNVLYFTYGGISSIGLATGDSYVFGVTLT